MSQFFLSPLVFLTSVSLLRCYDFELVLRNFDCSLEFVFSLLLLQPFNFSPVSFACNFQDWGCVILREIDFLFKICWSIPCLHPSWKVHTWNILRYVIQKALIKFFMSRSSQGKLPLLIPTYPLKSFRSMQMQSSRKQTSFWILWNQHFCASICYGRDTFHSCYTPHLVPLDLLRSAYVC